MLFVLYIICERLFDIYPIQFCRFKNTTKQTIIMACDVRAYYAFLHLNGVDDDVYDDEDVYASS